MMRFFRKYHKILGLFCSFFIIMSALSGIVLNHRKAFAPVDISRSLLPRSYHYSNWNNASVKGSFRLSADSILLYGGAGIWLTDSLHSRFSDFSAGLSEGADNRTTNKIRRTSSGEIFAVTSFDLYRLNPQARAWERLSEQAGIVERIADLEARADTLVVLTRSQAIVALYPFRDFRPMQLLQPQGYKAEATLFRTLWLLHSGELFGLPGQLIVGALGLCMIILCLTGLLYSFCPSIIRRRKQRHLSAKKSIKTMKKSLLWHNKTGATLLLFLLVLAISGMFLRPPLMIAIIRAKVKPVPGSVLASANPWHDKLRCIRYDARRAEWLLYASSGFYAMAGLETEPSPLLRTPPVSVMGVTVLEESSAGWLVGSFAGLYGWNRLNLILRCYEKIFSHAEVEKLSVPCSLIYHDESLYRNHSAKYTSMIFPTCRATTSAGR
ncbi:MAG: PepSY domain-containing protein [Tannerellaceae bacterium]|jgi:hypothetical protein|nr:PepSY domain-containing protein [Tannerellaceae bacterium]